MVDKADLKKYQPSCFLAHGLVNKLSVIAGYCDLLKDDTPEGSKCQERLIIIRKIAKQMVDELREHQCAIDGLTREAMKTAPLGRKPVSTLEHSE
jgi:hypothetical protein